MGAYGSGETLRHIEFLKKARVFTSEIPSAVTDLLAEFDEIDAFAHE
jgi:hypothetical protein